MSQEKFSLLRTILTTLGLPKKATEDILERIEDWLSEKDEPDTPSKIEYPYFIRDDFLSPAELSFFLVLKATVSDWAIILTKVSLKDLFYAKSGDPSKFRIATNKIDRKHVDFLLCDPKTVRPIAGIELDDKTHQRPDRQERDEFVEKVFAAAGLPLARIPVKHAYSVSEINSILQQIALNKQVPLSKPLDEKPVPQSPACPKCGSSMILRTAKSGTNQGGQFWGCSQYPQCRGIIKFEGH